ncbi:MAG: VTT domain-containing protein [Candidatus Korobacteraceae bacterium]
MTETLQFVLQYGYVLVFVWVMVEQAGLPVPVAPLLLACGALAGQQRMSLFLTVLAAAIASLITDSAWFYIGRRRGLGVLRLLCKISLEPDTCVRQTEAKFAKFGLRTLLFSKFVPGLNTAAAPITAVVGTPYVRFAPFAFAGAALWAASFTLAGYFFSNQISRITDDLQRLGSWALLLFIGAFIAYIGYRYYERVRFLEQVKGGRITPQELKAKLDLGQQVTIIDLRHPLDLLPDPHTLPGALRISPDELEARHSEISRAGEIILFCT